MKSLMIVLGVLVVATSIPAWLVADPDHHMPAELENRYLGIDVGGDPAAVTALTDQVGAITITEWIDGAPRQIDVRQEAGRWVIASKNAYPADGERKIGQTAAAVLGVEKIRLMTAESIRHGELGVKDPSDLELAGNDGRGLRVTVADVDGVKLVDVIVGGPVPDRPGERYVREVGSDQVYSVQLDYTALSSRFIDWVEPNPLEITSEESRDVWVRNYSVDFTQGTALMNSEVRMTRGNGESDWTTQSIPDGKIIDQDAVDDVVYALSTLRLSDVIQRVGLGAMELQQHGIMVQQNGQVIADEGEIHVTDANGFVYSVFFGEVVSSQGDQGGDSDRSIVVAVSYQSNADESKPSGQPTNPEEADEEAKKAASDALIAHLNERRERAERLNRKYSEFFYVISDEDFQKLRPKGASLFTDPEEDGESDSQ